MPAEQDPKTVAAMAALDTMAAVWAAKINARHAVRAMVALPDAEDRLCAFLQQAHAEGLFDGFHAGKDFRRPADEADAARWPDQRNRGLLQAAKQAVAALKKWRMTAGVQPRADLVYEAASYLEPAIQREEEFRDAAGADGAQPLPSDHSPGFGKMIHAGDDVPPLLYVASRASVAKYPDHWRHLRDDCNWPINSSWIDEAGPGETADMGELWQRIEDEVRAARGLVLWAEAEDFPLKGAYVEVGLALGMGKRVGIYTNATFEDRNFRPFGSWVNHPRVRISNSIIEAREWAMSAEVQA